MIGASGMVGHKMWQTLRTRFPDVVATIRRPRENYQSHPFYDGYLSAEQLIDRVDLWTPDSIVPLLDRLRPQVIVNCAGLTFRRENSDSVEDNIRLNALLPHVLCRWSERNGASLIAFSTDCVFSGSEGFYSEDSIPDASDAYGRTKALGEVRSSSALILRTSVIGREIEYRTQLVEWFLGQKEPAVAGYTRAIFSGVTTLYLSQLVAELIQRKAQGLTLAGVYNVASESISKHDLLQKLKKAYRVDIDIRPDDQKVVAKDLDGRRFTEATGLVVPSWDEMIAEMVADAGSYNRVVRQQTIG